MYILRIQETEDKKIQEALMLLRENGFDACIDSSYRLVTEEEVENELENNHDDLSEEEKELVLTVAAEDLYLKYDIFDNELISDIVKQSRDMVLSKED